MVVITNKRVQKGEHVSMKKIKESVIYKKYLKNIDEERKKSKKSKEGEKEKWKSRKVR